MHSSACSARLLRNEPTAALTSGTSSCSPSSLACFIPFMYTSHSAPTTSGSDPNRVRVASSPSQTEPSSPTTGWPPSWPLDSRKRMAAARSWMQCTTSERVLALMKAPDALSVSSLRRTTKGVQRCSSSGVDCPGMPDRTRPSDSTTTMRACLGIAAKFCVTMVTRPRTFVGSRRWTAPLEQSARKAFEALSARILSVSLLVASSKHGPTKASLLPMNLAYCSMTDSAVIWTIGCHGRDCGRM
mmetsp:Transcript_10694/g.25215  ORF Transcript_10694/g.25215 Transcript_10694/m.25215 type:complete len:243 (+) Transcript_10694:692-1420(+)